VGVLVALAGLVRVERRDVRAEDRQIEIEEDARVGGLVRRQSGWNLVSLCRLDQAGRSLERRGRNNAGQQLAGKRGAPLFVVAAARIVDRVVQQDRGIDRERIVQLAADLAHQFEQRLRMAPGVVAAHRLVMQPADLIEKRRRKWAGDHLSDPGSRAPRR
jgi:hypothetical protein